MIEMMKIDMGGCAAVLGAATALGHLKPKVLPFQVFVVFSTLSVCHAIHLESGGALHLCRL